jgi:hypothetical protein
MLEIIEAAQQCFGARQYGRTAQIIENEMVGALGVEGEKQGFL